MELKEYIRIVRIRGWIVILLAVLAAGAAAFYSKFFMQNIYQAVVVVSVKPARADWGLGQAIGGL
ncbi:MAG: hypothetical protein JW934_07630, partial [Anaerolineae bacterium]|nr:hypothetical protein [Anaerolineae bacterium]